MNAVFGSGLSSVLTVNGFGRFQSEVERQQTERGTVVRELADALASADLSSFSSADSARIQTAIGAKKLVEAMGSSDEVGRVSLIAAFADARLQALGKSIATAAETSRLIRSTTWPFFSVIDQIDEAGRARGTAILAQVRGALAADELDVALAPAIEEAIRQTKSLIAERQKPIEPLPPIQPPKPIEDGWTPKPPKVIRTAALKSAKAADTKASVDELLVLLAQKPAAKVNLSWEVVEE
jgi:hypothetical protein